MKKSEPTYTAIQIKEMCNNRDMNADSFKILAELINEELELYSPEDMPILVHASMIIFTRSLLKGSIKFR